MQQTCLSGKRVRIRQSLPVHVAVPGDGHTPLPTFNHARRTRGEQYRHCLTCYRRVISLMISSYVSRNGLALWSRCKSTALILLFVLCLGVPILVRAQGSNMKTFTYKILAPKGEDLKLDVHRLPGDDIRPGAIFIHGGALMGGDRKMSSRPGSLLPTLLNAGYAVVSIDYRLAPNVKLPVIIEDLRDAYSWVHQNSLKLCRIDPKQIFVMGQSAGGYLTQMTGFCVEPRPQALVSFWGYGDITSAWYSRPDPFYRQQPLVTKEEAEAPGSRKLYLYCRQQGLWPKVLMGLDPDSEPRSFDPYCPVRNVTKKYPPIMLVHGTQDTDVPYELSVQMDQELTAKKVPHEFVTITNGIHGFRSKVDAEIEASTYKKMLEFLDKYRTRKE